jgi:hypothetical protein
MDPSSVGKAGYLRLFLISAPLKNGAKYTLAKIALLRGINTLQRKRLN